ncbi:MAG: nucleotide exchange factor GrpE [Candidatus Staskawiczbacteria bacterium RIFCSPHIGHO2_02_FULL_34_9]|uniref:Protein GrpE n=1 Tax=Candidatus Staskawiczbacteria bacterium RIFCSPHIGHO2_02_FULL_34_9 TaxID=1802206 RepID=A0A1G2I3H3_9BACT|nr:MAG: nucleotide exchange factor GrpE [Candidatus Staskawiczbacteria bacterium RIFCSPHIGHO2_02_FULL_34_9]
MEQENIKKDLPRQAGENNIDKLAELEKKSEEYLNNWKRERADFINYKKDEAERMLNLVKYAKEDMILEILPILDNIYLAEKSVPENIQEDNWIKGFKMIQKQLEDFLKQKGIEQIETMGKQFNPETMEAISETEDSGFTNQDSGIVTEELQKGYIMDDKVLRPARVKISK